MSEPVRSIIFFADENGISPPEPQFAGVQGEHNATEVKFQLSSALTSPEYLYRIEFSDAAGEYDSTDFIPISGSFVNYLLPENWTKAGGVGVIHLCAVVLDANGREEQEVYSLAGRLKFAPRESGGMKTKYEKGLSALISEAGKATDAANEAAENANAAADRVDESVSSANTAAANANRAAASADASAATAMSAAGTATTAAGAANTAASQAQAAKAAADTAASGADASAEQARTAAANANTAAGTANTAASNANAIAQTVQAKLDAGELKGEKGDKGDTGPEGPQGVSGVYVGSGEMPEGYTVQVDPTGDMLCYTAGESDDRYANVLTGTASGPVAALEDVSPTGALRRAAVLGATTETGEGDKGPDNPYTIAGVQPTKVTVCGRNLLAYPYTSKTKTEVGVTFTDLGDGAITCSGTCSIAQGVAFDFRGASEPFTCFPGFTYSVSGCPVGGGDSSVGTYCIRAVEVKDGTIIWNNRYTDTGHGITFQVTEKKQFVINFTVWGSATVNNLLVRPQIEVSPAATPYTPYTGQIVPLPALEPLYGTGDIRDEYDAATGVENRRWKRVVFDGTEAWAVSATGTAGKYRVSLSIEDILPTATFSQASSCRCSHYATISADNTYHLQVGISANYGTSHGIFIYDDAYDVQDVTGWKAYLAAQYAAGTPVTVVYQLDAPAVTQHDPARILPPAPVCRVFADAGTMEVGYNRDVNMAFEQQQAEYIARIEALDARITQLEAGQPAKPMT